MNKKLSIMYRKFTKKRLSKKTIQFFLSFILLLITIATNAAWLEKYPVTVTQPDGTILHLFVTGDEYHHRVHDTDGYTLLKNAEGWVVYAVLENNLLVETSIVYGETNLRNSGMTIEPNLNISADKWRQLRSQFSDFTKSADRITDNPKNSPAPITLRTGTLNNIVIYIDFPDEPFTYSKEQIEPLFTSETKSESLYSYFRDISNGNFNISSSFYPQSTTTILAYTTPNPRIYYEIDNGDEGGKMVEHTLLKEAIEYVKNEIEANFTASQLDYNNDGDVDNICFVVQGEPGEWSTLLWPHRWALYTEECETFIHGKQVWDYNLIVENHLMTVSNGKQSVLVHETYHTLGAPDLYCYGSTTNNITPIGNWCVMASNTIPPQSSTAHITHYYGNFIADIPEITQSGTYTLYDTWDRNGNPVAYKITSPTSDKGEFFVLEYRRKNGGTLYESNIPNQGIIISRINPTANGNAGSDGTNTPFGVYVYRENGTYTNNGNLTNACFKSDGLTSFSDDSSPRAFLSNDTDGLGGIVIEQFSAAGGDSMTFCVKFPDNSTWEIGDPVATNITASLDNNGTLTIAGTGEMKNFYNISMPPWYCMKDEITDVIIENGITTIGSRAFQDCSLLSATISNSVSSIGNRAFQDCVALTDLYVEWTAAPPSFLPTIDPFAGVITANINLHIPDGTECEYGFASVWKDFNIMGVPFTITASAGSNGTVSPMGTTEIICGKQQQFTFTPNPGYIVDQLLIDDMNIADSISKKSYTFNDITDSHTIHVTFAINDIPCDDYTIGTGGQNTQELPLNNLWNYSYTQQIFDASEIGVFSSDITINSISFKYYESEYLLKENQTIYLGNTTKSSFAGASDWIPANQLTQVYFGEILLDPSDEWLTIEFDTPFEYTGDNVVVAWLNAGSSFFGNIGFHKDQKTALKSLVKQDGTPIDIWNLSKADKMTEDRNQVIFNICGKIVYEITAAASAGGSISPNGVIEVTGGTDQTFTFTPDACFKIDTVLVNNVPVTISENSYTFYDVQGGSTIFVSFKETLPYIYAEAGANGYIDPNDTIWVICEETYPFNFYADPGYEIDSVWVDGVFVSSAVLDESYTFSNVTETHSIFVTFKQISYNILSSASTGGTIDPSGNISVFEGEDQTFTFEPYPCYEIDTLFVNGVPIEITGNSYTFYDIQGDSTIYVSFKHIQYEITATAETNGTISPDGTMTIGCGTDQIFYISPNECYEIDTVWVNDVPVTISNNRYIFYDMQGDSTIHVTFKEIELFVYAEAGANGVISPNDTTWVNCNDTLSYIFYADQGYEIDSVWVDGVFDSSAVLDESYTFNNITEIHSIVVTFKQKSYIITATAGIGGTIDPSGYVSVFEGDSIIFTFEPYECYEIDTVIIIDDIPISDYSIPELLEIGYLTIGDTTTTFTFTNVTEEHTIFVDFNQFQYTITATAGENGTISPDGELTVYCGDYQTFLFFPDECYQVDTVWVNDLPLTGIGNSYTFFDVTEEQTISVSFSRREYTISASALLNGSISPNGLTPVFCGENQTFTFTPDDCYEIDQVYIDGLPILDFSNNSYTFEDVTEYHAISVSFILKTHTITASAGANGSISPSGTDTFDCGDSQTYIFIPDPGFEINMVIIDGTSNVNALLNGYHTFDYISANHNIYVSFKPETYHIKVTADPWDGGTVTGNIQNIDIGEEWTVTATPLQNYIFVNWTENGIEVSDTAVYTFEVEGSRDLVANFTLKSYNVTLIPSPPEGGEVFGGGDSITHGTYLEVLAKPYPQFTFFDWSENGVYLNQDSSFIFPVTYDRTLTAHFIPKTYNITTSFLPIGSGMTYGGGYNFTFGTDTCVWAVPLQNWVFDYWSENGIMIDDRDTLPIVVTKSQHLVAHFKHEKLKVTVEADPPAGGQVSGGGNNITYGDSTVVYVDNISSNYDFIGWYEDNIFRSLDLEYSFTVTHSCTLVAKFTLKIYNILVEADPPQGGDVFENMYGVVYDTDTSVFAVAHPHFTFWKWTENNVTVCSYEYYPFSVSHSCTLVAHFIADSYEINVSANPPTWGEVSGGGTYTYGTYITVTATPDSCHYFVNWTENGDTVSSDASFSFEVEEPRDLVANFETLTYNITTTAIPAGGGTFTGSGNNIECGTEITVCAIPNVGYVFDYWLEDGQIIEYDSCLTFTVLEDRDLEAHFTYLEYTIELWKNPTVGGGIVWGGGTFPLDSVITVHAEANPCYEFTEWRENDSVVSNNADYTFAVKNSRLLIAYFTSPTYSIDVSASPGGYAGTVVGNDSLIPCNEWRTIEAYPEPYFEFVNWTINGEHFSFNAIDSFPVLKNYNLTANFKLQSCSLNINAEPDEGGYVDIIVNGGGGGSNIPLGSVVTLTANANMNYYFSHWTLNGIDKGFQNPWSFEVLECGEIVAHFTKKNFTINLYALDATGGNVSGEGTFPADTIITVKAMPNNNYTFKGWYEDGGKVYDSLNFTFAVTRDRELYAHFELAQYEITLSPNPDPAGGIVSGAGTYTYGDTATVIATPNDFYTFIDWTENTISVCSDSIYKFSVDGPRHLVANFTSVQHLVTLKPEPPLGGNVEGEGYFYHNAKDTVRATANTGFVFKEWREGDTFITDNPEYIFNVTSSITLTAIFESRFVDVTTSSEPIEGGGTSGGGLDLPIGTTVTVVATPYPEYQFMYWTIDDVVIDTAEATYTFVAMETCHLIAHFTKNKYTITLIADPPYCGTVSGGGEIPYGEEITVNAQPFSGYGLMNWTENGVSVSDNEDYTFTVTGNRTLTAHFDIKRYHVTVESNDTLYGFVTGGGIHNLYDTVTIKAFINQGYSFANWTKDSVFVTSALTYTFVVTEDVHFVANFYGLDFDTYAATLWDNTFMLNFTKLEADGYIVTGCKWFKNNIELLNTNTIDEFSYSAGPNQGDLLELAPTFYTYHLTIKDGTILYSTKKVLDKYEQEHAPPTPTKLFIYPNPTPSGNMFTIEGTIPGESLQVYSQTGVFLKSIQVSDTTTTLSLDFPAGVYFIRNGNKEGKVTIIN